MTYKKIKKNVVCKKGTALVTAIMILSVLFAVSLGGSTIIVSQIKTIRNMENSIQAYFAAETGIEHILYTTNVSSGEIGGAGYDINIISGGTGNCPSDRTCIESTGSFRGTKRAIRVTK